MTVEARLERLERRYRALQCCTVLMILVGGGTAFMAQTKVPPKEITARGFLLVDAAGHTLGQWGEFGGKVGFSLWGAGEPRLILAAGSADAGMTVGVSNGMTAQLIAGKDVAAVQFLDRKGKTLGNVGTDATGTFHSGPPK